MAAPLRDPGLGDAAAYQKTYRQEDSAYYDIQTEIDNKIKEFDTQNRAHQHGDCPLIVIAHSLGSHIVSSYTWDVNKLKQQPASYVEGHPNQKVVTLWKELTAEDATPFRRLETFAGFVTIGSNIPVFTFAFGVKGTFPITHAPEPRNGTTFARAFPGAALPAELATMAEWKNFYSDRDVLGYPVKPLNGLFGRSDLIKDICVQSEAGFWGYVPLYAYYRAHVGYWTNTVVLDQTAALIRKFAGED